MSGYGTLTVCASVLCRAAEGTLGLCERVRVAEYTMTKGSHNAGTRGVTPACKGTRCTVALHMTPSSIAQLHSWVGWVC